MSSRRLIRAAALAVCASAVFAGPGVAAEPGYPAVDRRYHSYPEMAADIHAEAAAHPSIVRVFSIGDSYQGRAIWAAEVSDRVGVDEGEPEVLFDGLHHAREHLSAEESLSILHLLADHYGHTDALGRRVTRIVNTRRVWIIFMVNPDGLEKDLAGGPYGGGHYAGWRKNVQPTLHSKAIGTDINRNYGYDWGCCEGSSGDPRSDMYRGPRAWSTPEARAVRDFVLSRVVNGRQRIRTHITFHTAGQQVLWPYGHTYRDLPSDMTALDRRTFVKLGRHMAATNGYTPMQSSGLYITAGDEIDWLYGAQRIFSFTFEMYPANGAVAGYRSDYPPDEIIGRETRRNQEAVLYLMEMADCPYRAIGLQAAYCGPFFDDLEMDRGWTVDAGGKDTATAGAWARGVARASTFQLSGATSGEGVLVTGRAVATDVDGGSTSVRSPTFKLPAGKAATLHLRYWVGLDADAGAADGLTVRLVSKATGAVVATALEVRGDGHVHAPAWRSLTFAIPDTLGGSHLAVELVASDAGPSDATVEAAVDDVRVTASAP